MNLTPFDKHIKGELKNYQPPVPPDIWDKIMAGKERERPVIFWWQNKGLWVAAVLLILAGGTFFLKSPLSKHSTGTPTSTISSQQGDDLSSIGNNNTEPISKKVTPQEQVNAKVNGTETVIDSLSLALNYQANSASANSDKAAVKPTGNMKENADFYSGKTGKLLPVNSHSTSAGKSVSISQNWTGDTDATVLLPGNAFTASVIKYSRSTSTFQDIKHPPLPLPCPEIEKNTSGNKKYLEIYAGPDYNTSIITDQNTSYAAIRKSTTSMRLGYSAGLRYTKVFSNGMSFRTGINVSQVNETLNYKVGDVVQIQYIISNSGDTTGTYAVKGSQYSKSQNIYRTADVPLLLGYELGNERIHLNLNAGAIINIHSWQKGFVIDTSNAPVSISKGSNNRYGFKTNAGVGFMAGAALYYKLSETWHLFTEPYVRYNLNQANKTDITLKQKFNTAGLHFGLRKDLK